MPRSAWGFDGDTAYYEALKAKVLQDQANAKAEKKEAERQRRASLGLPEDENKSWLERRKSKAEEKKAHPERKKSIGEKIGNFVFNGGRPEKFQNWQESRGFEEFGSKSKDKVIRETEPAPKRFTCSTCSRGFSRSADLARHNKHINCGVRPPGRDEEFAQQSAWTVDSRVYTGEKPPMPMYERSMMTEKEENQPPPSQCKVVLANNIAKGLLSEVQTGLETFKSAKRSKQPPHLLGILANEDTAAKTYADWTGKTCIEHGFLYTLKQIPRDNVEEEILQANKDSSIDGIIVYYPIFNNRQDQYIQECVTPEKDVEGLTHLYRFNLFQNTRFLDPPANTQKSILPCTPLAVIKILEYLQIYNNILPYGNRLFGHTICVVNRSEVVGRPLAALLANDGASVYSVDVTGVQKFTRGEGLRKRKHEVEDLPESFTLDQCVPLCDVVITGVPSTSFAFPTRLLREGAVCINFSSEKNFDTKGVKEKASIYVPAIGKVTIAILLRNLVRLAMNRVMRDGVDEGQKMADRAIAMAMGRTS